MQIARIVKEVLPPGACVVESASVREQLQRVLLTVFVTHVMLSCVLRLCCTVSCVRPLHWASWMAGQAARGAALSEPMLL